MHVSTKLAIIQALSASAEINTFFAGHTKSVTPKLKPYIPKMVTSSDKEIAAWNAKVEAKKKAKRTKYLELK